MTSGLAFPEKSAYISSIFNFMVMITGDLAKWDNLHKKKKKPKIGTLSAKEN